MLLKELLSGVPVISEAPELENCLVNGVVCDSHADPAGCLFVCLKGRKADGHAFARMAEQRGAAAVLCERDCGCLRQILTPDTRQAYGLICANLYEHPAASMELTAVTGTNGKTSVATIVKRMLEEAGVKTGLISTIQAEYPGESGESRSVALSRTTPDAMELHRLLSEMRAAGVEKVVMEASSHALDQERLYGLRFAVGIFTNLTQDHLDYHRDMEDYFRAKCKLFDQADFGVINLDDPYGRQLAGMLSVPFETCSVKDPAADLYADEIVCDERGVRFRLRRQEIQCRVSFPVPGLYSVYNAMEAAAVCMRFGMPFAQASEGLARVGTIRGRNERIETGRDFTVICDYAHTPDGLENLLRSTRAYAKGRIILVFGCGGDRDKAKRPKMGEIAAQYADFLVVTSDNPRTERPGAIIGEILRGIPRAADYIVIEERRDAIRYALTTARRGDIVLLAGKGHERYQVLGDKTLYFDERRLVEGILRSL